MPIRNQKYNRISDRISATGAIVVSLALVAFQPAVYGHNQSHLLRGEVNDNTAAQKRAEERALGYITNKDANGKTVVQKVIPGSSAYYRGMRSGDVIVNSVFDEQPNNLHGVLRIERSGTPFSLNLMTYGDYRRQTETEVDSDSQTKKQKTTVSEQEHKNGQVKPPVAGSPSSAPYAGEELRAGVNSQSVPQSVASRQLNGGEEEDVVDSAKHCQAKVEKALQGHELIVLIDRSGSMETTDCPGATSRWQWCRQQVSSLSEETKSCLPSGFSLVLFNNHIKSVSATGVQSISEAFSNNKPDGGTDIAGAVSRVLKERHERLLQNQTQPQPLVLVIITDGAVNDERSLRNTLISTSNELQSANELSVVFLQVGEDNQAAAYLEELDRSLVQEGAHFKIAHTLIFADVKQRGLLRALADSVN